MTMALLAGFLLESIATASLNLKNLKLQCLKKLLLIFPSNRKLMQRTSTVPANLVLSVPTTNNISCLRAINLKYNSSVKKKKVKLKKQKKKKLAGMLATMA